MASRTSGTIFFGFAAVFCCLELLEATNKIEASQSGFTRLAAVAFLPAILTTLGLTLLLLFSYIRALGANGEGGRRFLQRLTKATQLTAMAALLAGVVLLLVASGYLGNAEDDVVWLYAVK